MIKSRRNFIAALWGTAFMAPVLKLPTPSSAYWHLKGCGTRYEFKEILHARPARKCDIASRTEAPFVILMDRHHRDLIQLNPLAARIWELCDGRTGVDAIVQRITDDYDITSDGCVHDVVITLLTLKRRGLILC